MAHQFEEELAVHLNVKPEECTFFEEMDAFNGNKLSGALCHRGDYRYGAIGIFRINDVPTYQFHYCTPKLEYPFDRNGDFHWPVISQLEIWDKLDGTNIFAYRYQYKERWYLTFKTRLTPVLRDGNYGSFLSMWQEYMSKNPWVLEVINNNPQLNLSFEMFGSRNPITVVYSIPLEVNLLFGVDKDAKVYPPSKLIKTEQTKTSTSFSFEQQVGFTDIYNNFRTVMSEKIKQNNDALVLEGVVLYAKTADGWKMFKCKPEEIEKIHWAAGGIPKAVIWTTCINTYESNENPTLENVLTLMKEEFTEQQIGRSAIRIEKLYREVCVHMAMVKQINEIWKLANEKGFDITKDKSGTMRFISQYFKKDEMKKVGTIVLQQAGLIKRM